MTKKYLVLLQMAFVCLLSAAQIVQADDESLGVGKAPPTLEVLYIKNEAPDFTRETGCVMVVFLNQEDSTTANLISSLNSMCKDYGSKGLQVVAIAKGKSDEIGKAFTKAQKKLMIISLGADESENTWSKWVDASKIEKLPLAFMISRNKIVWVGNPMDDSLPAIIRLAVVGKYDPQLQKKAQPMLDAARKALKVRNVQEAYKHYDEVIELDGILFLDVLLERYKATLKNETDPKIASEWMQKTAKKSGNIACQREIITAIVKDPEIQQRDLELALTIAESMASKNPTASLECKAMVSAAKKDWDQAIDLQTDALMAAPASDKPMAKQRLDEYRAASKRVSEKNP